MIRILPRFRGSWGARSGAMPVVALLGALLSACASTPPRAPAGAQAATFTDYGAPFDASVEHVALDAIARDASLLRGRVVRTEGSVARVCQRMGCWIELAAADGTSVRVPMAGHAFFLPRDVAGRRAEVVGRVNVEELSEERRAHLESEGARATSGTVVLEALSVRVH